MQRALPLIFSICVLGAAIASRQVHAAPPPPDAAISDGIVGRGFSRTDNPVRNAVESHLRRLGAAELPRRCQELAAKHGLAISRVIIRNQRTRWGSCSTRGGISLNWRLVQMPPGVSDYVILHELMHLKQPNHSRKFWREVAAVCDHWSESEHWLKRFGRALL